LAFVSQPLVSLVNRSAYGLVLASELIVKSFSQDLGALARSHPTSLAEHLQYLRAKRVQRIS
jgi:hypothetical protein